MKNRILPSGLLTAFLGLSFLLFSVMTMAGQPGDNGAKKYDGKSRIERIRVNQLTGTVSSADEQRARQQFEEFQSNSKGTLNLDWISMGPTNYAGATWSVMFDNKDNTSYTLYAGAANGGIWRSTNFGLTWHQMNTMTNIIPKVSCLVQTTTGTIYASTGVTFCGSADFLGTGLYRSDDGINFEHVANTSGHNWASVAKMAVDLRNNRIFAATNSGLLYSDNGTEWIQVREGYCNDVVVGTDGTILTSVSNTAYLALGGDVNNFVNISTGGSNGLPDTDVGWQVFAIAPADVNVMYASVADTFGNLYNVYRSIDKGANWSIIFPGNNTWDPYRGQGCYASTLAVFPNDPYQILLGGREMWWGRKILETGYYDWQVMSFGSAPIIYEQYAPYDHHAYVFRPGFPTQLALATDGGVTTAIVGQTSIAFKTSNKNYVVSRFNSITASREKSNTMGGGENIGTQVLGAFYPSQVNNPTDGYQIWWSDQALRISDEGGTGGYCAWSMIAPNTVFFAKVGDSIRRQELTDLTYANGFNMGIYNTRIDLIPFQLWENINFENTRDSVKYKNKTKNEIPADTMLVVESSNASFKFEYTTLAPIPAGDSIMVPDPVAARFFLSGNRAGNNGIWMTKDALKFTGTPTWFKVFVIPASDTAYTNDPISTITVSQDLNTLWAGTERGRLIRLSNLVLAYNYNTADVASPMCIISNSKFDNLPFKDRFISSISINPNDSRQVLITLGNYDNNNYVYMTQNANDSLPTFTAVQGNLPPVPVFSGLIEMHDNNRAIIGTEFGVFSTSNLLGSNPEWNLEMLNMGDVPVTDIKQQTNDNYVIKNLGAIYAATYGRGIFMDTTFYTPLGMDPGPGYPVAAAGTLRISPNPVKDRVNITYVLESSGSTTAQISDLTGRTVLMTSFGEKPKGVNTSSLDLRSLPVGTYIVRVGHAFGKIVKIN